MATYGGLLFGPVATKWYSLLSTRVHLSTSNRTIAARVACDQFIFAPINMGVFLSSMAYFEGSSPKERLKKAYVPGLTNNFLLWPWVQAVNFKYVPLEHRVLVVNFVALGKLTHFLVDILWFCRKVTLLGLGLTFVCRLELLPQLPEQRRR